jgi:hypothetical protein
MSLCLFASCAVYDAPPSRKTGAQNGGSSGTSDTAKGGDEDNAGGRGGTGTSGTTGGAGTVSGMHPGGTDAGSPHAAGAPDGGAADGGAGDVSGGSGDQAGDGAGGATGGGGTGGTLSSGGGGSGGTLSSGGGGMGGSPPITELSRQKPATASSQQTGNEPASGNDGDGVTRWCAKAGTFPQWWRVDLGATHLLKEFKISFEYTDRKYYYDIETSADDSAYTLQARASGMAALQTGAFPDGVSARYVRLTVTNADPLNTSKTWASFFEFTVTGS